MCFTIRHEKRLAETLKLPSLGSFKVFASISEAAMSCLGQNFERLVSAQKVSCTSLKRTETLRCQI